MHLHPVVQATKQGLGGREPPDALQHLDPLGMQLRHRHSFFPRSSGRPLASMAAMPSLGSRRWLRYGIVAVAVLLVLAGGAVAFVLAHSPHNISHPNVEFTEPATTTPPAAPAKKVDTFSWPRYGFDAARTRTFTPANAPEPPLRVGWRFQDFALLEFPPVIYQNRLYLVDDNGSAKALDKGTGHKLWETKIGTLAAASPALGIKQGLVYFAVLSAHGKSPG